MNKYYKLYTILKCPINIPINDIDAWNMYPEYRFIYNKIFISEYQNVPNAPMPIIPSKYPVIIKPIINIYGMGLNIIKINNKDEFLEQWYNNNFWMDFLEGDHLSFDIIILNGIIQVHACFKGHKAKEIGEFIYWESTDDLLPEIAKKIINEKFKKYSGVLNLETIGGTIIEAHLRMGDIDVFPTLSILKGIIETYQGNEYNWKQVEFKKVYFFPLWLDIDIEEHKLIHDFAHTNIYKLMDNNSHIYNFDIDKTSLAFPSNNKRVLSFSCGDMKYGFLLIESLKKMIGEYMK